MKCGQVHDIGILLTGFGIPAQSLAGQLDQLRSQLASSITAVYG